MATKTFNISMPEELIKRADRLAKNEQSNRSELLRTALRNYLQEREEWEKVFVYGERQAKKLNIKEEDVVRLVREVRQGK
jgi:metal-responsive CopG/Arc/MetJ family transcriptional regulator